MTIAPTPVTAALAGVFSGLTWPWIWPFVQGTSASSTLWLVLGTIVLVAVPAHALVLGVQPGRAAAPGAVDSALLVRVAAWLACAAFAAVALSMLRGTA